MYTLCVRDYEFHILDNGFLVHRPGIKVGIKEQKRSVIIKEQTKFINSTLKQEYEVLYGKSPNCPF